MAFRSPARAEIDSAIMYYVNDLRASIATKTSHKKVPIRKIYKLLMTTFVRHRSRCIDGYNDIY